jgi:hypothetical protein
VAEGDGSKVGALLQGLTSESQERTDDVAEKSQVDGSIPGKEY